QPSWTKDIYYQCCGDDTTDDNFYTGTIGTTDSFCYQGVPTFQTIDENHNLCGYYSYIYFTGTNTGTNYNCCGDDTTDDNFYTGTLATTTHFCYQGQYVNRDLDSNRTLCEYYGYAWLFENSAEPITYSFSNYEHSGTSVGNWFFGGGAVGGYGMVVDSIDNRNKVIELYDPDTDPDVEKNFFSSADFPVSSGTISFWFRMADTSQFGIMELFKTGGLGASPVIAFGTASLGALNINSQLSCAEAGAASQTIVGSISQDTWHKVDMSFDNSESTFTVILDDAEPVECGLYDAWDGSDATAIFFQTGAIIGSGSSTHYIWLDDIYLDWSSTKDEKVCCGDDGVDDNFYNGTLATTTHFCYQGEFINEEIDENYELCEYYGFSWVSDRGLCCGDDDNEYYIDNTAFSPLLENTTEIIVSLTCCETSTSCVFGVRGEFDCYPSG
ncbi:MAG: hypothetical protein PHI86_07260, partial [Candidatus Omnitrophica bacterium]|nr:hypothetical protein [Candidatus Omnitrophota bacterium]